MTAPFPETGYIRTLIDAAHQEQRQVWDAGRGQEALTLEQHWSATAGWLASRIRGLERTGEPDWPDAANSAEPQGETDGAPFLSVPSGIDIARYFWHETDHSNPGCEGIDLYREGLDYCYLWVSVVVDHDMWMSYLLDVRTSVGNPHPTDKFNETRDYLFLMVGAGDMFEVEWHNQPTRFDAPTEAHRARSEAGMKWLADRTEKSIEDHEEQVLRPGQATP